MTQFARTTDDKRIISAHEDDGIVLAIDRNPLYRGEDPALTEGEQHTIQYADVLDLIYALQEAAGGYQQTGIHVVVDDKKYFPWLRSKEQPEEAS